MKLKYLLLLILLLLIDIFAFSEVAALLRQPSDKAVASGLFLLVLLAIINLVIIRYIYFKNKSE